MSEAQFRVLLGIMGIAAQLIGSILLVGLFLLLRRYATGRGYFEAWERAWIAVSIAIGTLAIRYLVMPQVVEGQISESDLSVRALYLVYQSAKIVYVGMMVYGAMLYARVPIARERIRWYWIAALSYAFISVLLSGGLSRVVVMQGPITVLGMTYCGYLLLTLPGNRRSLGSRVTGVSFTLIAVLWTLYIVAFNTTRFMVPGVPRASLDVVINYNTYLDLLLQVVLGYAMVVLLMEDAKSDVDTAHAELASAHEQLRRASFHDTLTGALNRRAFVEGVGLDEAHAFGGSVVALDLDNLKLVNDSFGHAAGDQLLRRLAEVVRSIVRPSDTLYRWGGDEFLLVLPGAHASDVQPRVEDVISQSNLLRIREANPDHLRLLVSVGASDFTGPDDLESAIERADNAMYAQKAKRKLTPTPPVQLRAIPRV